jgi:hypothetical protein
VGVDKDVFVGEGLVVIVDYKGQVSDCFVTIVKRGAGVAGYTD